MIPPLAEILCGCIAGGVCRTTRAGAHVLNCGVPTRRARAKLPGPFPIPGGAGKVKKRPRQFGGPFIVVGVHAYS